MTDVTARLALPLLQAGQAQKEIFHNEALMRIDALVHPVVVTLATDSPPVSPAPGMCWIVGSSPTGAWSGQAGRIAAWTDGGWRFITPSAGMTAWLADVARWAWHDGTGWRGEATPSNGIAVAGQQVVGARQPAIIAATGGATIDQEARESIAAILAAIRSHGLIAT